MTPVLLPPVKAIRGEAFGFSMRIRSDTVDTPRAPVDLTPYTAAFSVGPAFGEPATVSSVPELTENGFVTVRLTAAETALLPATPVMGGRVSAVFQITLTPPDDGDVAVFQGSLSVAEKIE